VIDAWPEIPPFFLFAVLEIATGCAWTRVASDAAKCPVVVGILARCLLVATTPACRSIVRFIVGISLLLLGAGLFACQVEGFSARSSAKFSTPWVRTVDGWERPGSWTVRAVGPPAVHPLVVAAGQTLVSVLGLAFFERDSRVGGRKC
jgi:hypothetical protein